MLNQAFDLHSLPIYLVIERMHTRLHSSRVQTSETPQQGTCVSSVRVARVLGTAELAIHRVFFDHSSRPRSAARSGSVHRSRAATTMRSIDHVRRFDMALHRLRLVAALATREIRAGNGGGKKTESEHSARLMRPRLTWACSGRNSGFHIRVMMRAGQARLIMIPMAAASSFAPHPSSDRVLSFSFARRRGGSEPSACTSSRYCCYQRCSL